MKTLRHSLLLAGFCGLLALSAQATEKDLTLPADVVALADRAAACQRWSGAEIGDQSDDTLVEHQLSRLKCDTLASEAAKLQHKYAGSEPALKAIEAVHALGF